MQDVGMMEKQKRYLGSLSSITLEFYNCSASKLVITWKIGKSCIENLNFLRMAVMQGKSLICIVLYVQNKIFGRFYDPINMKCIRKGFNGDEIQTEVKQIILSW